MRKDYKYFQSLLLAWHQGHKTGSEITDETKDFLNIREYEKEFDLFIYAFEESIDEYDNNIGYEWEEYKEYAVDTAPTIKGLCHNINQVIVGNQVMDDFIDWATWHNSDSGETTSGRFENRNIEFFCLYFIPENYKKLDIQFYQEVIQLIEKSKTLNYGEFVIGLYLLLENEQKSLYFFFKEYIEGRKNEKDLEKYLVKMFGRSLPEFTFDLTVFPYTDELNRYRDEKLNIDEFMAIIK